MLLLILGLSLFFGLHLLRELGLRQKLVSRMGLALYKVTLACGMLVALVLIVYGKGEAPFVQLWVPPYNLRALTQLLMISACILLAATFLPNSHTRTLVMHPMLSAVIVWGISHLLSNGDLASVLLFGGFSLWAMIKIISLQTRSDNTSGRPRPALIWDAAAITVGMIVYSLLLVFHGPLFGFALMVQMG
ncbi:MAG: NnrU family protein [Pseudomonadales bacterium]|nr:hypothetical protein [Pseudomonadales bacterium]MCP5330405.1 NnrU family protein [Pseudomonadales bacterium]MCP5343982.1 NnrU family protein [Pseudomonadales bacterium]